MSNTNNIKELDKIISEICNTAPDCIPERLCGDCDTDRQRVLNWHKAEVARIIGEDDDVHSPINPESDEDLVITLSENANNRLRAEQRNKAGL